MCNENLKRDEEALLAATVENRSKLNSTIVLEEYNPIWKTEYLDMRAEISCLLNS